MHRQTRLNASALRARVRQALKEDAGAGDATSRLLVPSSARGRAVILAREAGIFCGRPVLEKVFRLTDRRLRARFAVGEGKPFKKNQTVLRLEGPVQAILKAERLALNFLAHLSGIATLTRCYVDKTRGTRARILDTRKTTPGWRDLEKYAVKCGGGENHRFGLYDAVLVKENHRRFGRLKNLKRLGGKFEIEVRNQKELEEALALKPAIILFDNYLPAKLKLAVRFARKKSPKTKLEASGGVKLSNVRAFAKTGVDRISVGALTHSPAAVDFSLLLQ